MTDFPVTIYHNPRCGTSRNALAMIRAAGYEPEVVEYVQTGWTPERLGGLLERMGAPPRAVLRAKEEKARELGLLEAGVADETLLAAMVAHPTLVERPIVETPLGVTLARPSERVFEVLDRRVDSFTKEDGEVVRF